MANITRSQHIVSRLKDEGQQTLTFFKALAPEQWSMQVYDTGAEWDVRQVFCHFVSAERGLTRLYKSVAKGGEGAPPNFDIDRYNAEDVGRLAGRLAGRMAGRMDARQMDELLSQFQAVRAALVTFVEGLDEADLDRVGRHPFLGMVSLEKMLKMVYRHNRLHLKDIQTALQTGKPVVSSEA